MSAIHGYRDLSPEAITLINDTKTLASQVGELIDKLHNDPDTDKRWLAIGRTELQQGFMAVVRAIAKPTTF
jgi:hypothetical protein